MVTSTTLTAIFGLGISLLIDPATAIPAATTSAAAAPTSAAPVAVAKAAAAKAAAGAAINLGGIDMNAACTEQHGSWYHAEVDFDGCNGWKCYSTNGGGAWGIDVNLACKSQYWYIPGGTIWGSCPSNGGAYQWSCLYTN